MSSVFCLEGEWGRSVHSRESVLPLLELLDRLNETQYFHRDVATSDELVYYLKKFSRLSATTFPVLYLACHGYEEYGELGIDLGGATLSLDEVGRLLEGKLSGRILYFASCLVGSASDESLQKPPRSPALRQLWVTRLRWSGWRARPSISCSCLAWFGRSEWTRFSTVCSRGIPRCQAHLVWLWPQSPRFFARRRLAESRRRIPCGIRRNCGPWRTQICQ